MDFVDSLGRILLLMSAFYLCAADTESDCYLSVYKDGSLVEDDVASLVCECHHCPSANISWYKQGDEDNVFFGETTFEDGLTVSVFNKSFHRYENYDNYTCSASDANCTETLFATVTNYVIFTPEIMTMEAVLTSDHGRLSGKVELLIESNAKFVKSYLEYDTLKLDTFDIVEVNNVSTWLYTAKLANLPEPVSGEVRFVGIDLQNEVVATIFVEGSNSAQVWQLPTLEAQDGDTVSVACNATDVPVAYKYVWTRVSATCKYDFYAEGYVLQLTVSSTSDGRYYCKGYDSNNRLESAAFFDLKVTGSTYCPHYVNSTMFYPPEVTVVSELEADLGQDVSVVCHVFAYPSAYRIQWTKDDDVISEGPILRLNNMTLESGGRYTCQALNMNYEEEKEYNSSSSLYLNVPHAPGNPSISPSQAVIAIGENVTFTCTADPTGYPSPQYTWTKDSSDEILSFESTLSISNANLTDAGWYSCQATNQLGSSENTSVLLDVMEPTLPPVFHIQQVDVFTGVTGFKLFCSAQGTSLSPVTWFKNGEAIYSGNLYLIYTHQTDQTAVAVHSTLYFTGTDRIEQSQIGAQDAGNYSCIVKNQTTEVHRIFNVQVHEHTPPPAKGSSKSKKQPVMFITVTCIIVAATALVFVVMKRRQTAKVADKVESSAEPEGGADAGAEPADAVRFKELLESDQKKEIVQL